MKKFIFTMVMAMLLLIATAAPAFAGGHGSRGADRGADRGNTACDAVGRAWQAAMGIEKADSMTDAINCSP